MVEEKAHCVKVQMESISNNRLNQRVTFEEFADTSEELVGKHQEIANGVVGGILGATTTLAKPYAK